MTDLEKIIEAGLIKNGEEIYLDYNEFHFVAKIKEGKIIETQIGEFTSPSPAAGTLLALIDNGVLKRHPKTEGMLGEVMDEVICNGWTRWKNWNDVSLHDLRKKIYD